MTLPGGDIEELAWALLDEAVDEEHQYATEINIDQLRAILDKNQIVVDSLTTRFVFFQKKLFLPHYSNQLGNINMYSMFIK